MIYTDGTHLVSDISDAELHRFARKIGLKREWFQDKKGHPHYDLTTERKANSALLHGAKKIPKRAIVKLLNTKDRVEFK
jgi:hypothetical protein